MGFGVTGEGEGEDECKGKGKGEGEGKEASGQFQAGEPLKAKDNLQPKLAQ